MSDFKLFCEVNKEIDTELISELYSDAKCLLKSYLLKSHNFIFRDWNLNNPIQNWDYITVKNGRITTLNLHNNIIGTEDVKRLVLPSGLQTLYLSYNNIGADGAKVDFKPPGLKELYLSSNNIGDEGAKYWFYRTSNTIPLLQQYWR